MSTAARTPPEASICMLILNLRVINHPTKIDRTSPNINDLYSSGTKIPDISSVKIYANVKYESTIKKGFTLSLRFLMSKSEMSFRLYINHSENAGAKVLIPITMAKYIKTSILWERYKSK